jgi:hypothetical protein
MHGIKRIRPAWCLPGHRATAPALPQLRHPRPRRGQQVREPRPGFSNGILPVRKGTDVLSVSATGPVDPASSPHRGFWVEQQAILARTPC